MTNTTFQLLLRGIDGSTSCLKLPSEVITGSLLQEQISDHLHLPSDAFFLVAGSKVISSATSLRASSDGLFPSCNLLLRLRGGKGGFGSLLRGAATKAGQKKTSNFDACRDMSGRRLRHVNAEKKLKEWKSQEKERELEKVANEFLKKQMKKKKEDAGCSKEIENYREETSKAMEDVESAVAEGLLEAQKFGKRKMMEEDPSPTSTKRPHFWVIAEDDDMEEDYEDDDSDSEAEQLDDADERSNKTLTVSQSKNIAQEEITLEPKEGSNVDSCDEVKEIISTDLGEMKNDEGINTTSTVPVNENTSTDKEDICDKTITSEIIDGEVDNSLNDGSINNGLCVEHTTSNGSVDSSPLIDNNSLGNRSVDDSPSDDMNGFNNGSINNTLRNGNVCEHKDLNFDNFSSASDLEVLGLERLKSELQSRGLKCGGSLSERAARLFLLKTTPLEKLDKKLFVKSK